MSLPIVVPPAIALWRELHHDGDGRRWRCRPTRTGLRVEFWDPEDGSWSGRTLASKRVRPTHGSPDERELDVAASEGLALIAEQLADGMVDRSEPAATQSWTLLREKWSTESPDFDAARFFERAHEVLEPSMATIGTWLVQGSAGPFTMQTWWSEREPILPSDVTAARAGLKEHAEVLKSHLLLMLRWPNYPVVQVARAALFAMPLSEQDEADVFSVLFDLLVHPPSEDNLIAPAPFAERLSSSPERIEALAAFVRTTPYVLTAYPMGPASRTEDVRAYQNGQSALSMLERWAKTDPHAERAFRVVRDPLSRRGR